MILEKYNSSLANVGILSITYVFNICQFALTIGPGFLSVVKKHVFKLGLRSGRYQIGSKQVVFLSRLRFPVQS